MSTIVGRYRPPHEDVSIVGPHYRQIEFSNPREFLRYVAEEPGLEAEILDGQWEWSTKPVSGGH